MDNYKRNYQNCVKMKTITLAKLYFVDILLRNIFLKFVQII